MEITVEKSLFIVLPWIPWIPWPSLLVLGLSKHCEATQRLYKGVPDGTLGGLRRKQRA